ncbi:hypothetical protein FHR83_004419 [Actinoplanes campanulatus]|uniref:DUF4132 domain-containing protein n=1 Tax=Actinoplanes campanulatus TaxID=113559 RepID=A0A7W5FFV1_9ACTN|nr:DUF4132 domain-containing protein [Actinoplanes campanulatus]MBB3096745.1 hypothetical protein [Actinoplanes campanulatus]GGN31001.1 hypothetical protein GCM10010109_51030 [Actinoplanes campanulatus]GID37288.1 hypothetical protein Aca09nite_37940 [Actinoplanes campanulatus]
MFKWLDLIPPPGPGEVDTAWVASADPSAMTDDGERRRLLALRWHLATAEIEKASYDRDPEIYRIAAGPLPWTTGDLGWALRVAHGGRIYDGMLYHLPLLIAERLPAERLAAFEPALAAILEETCSGYFMPRSLRDPLAERYERLLTRVGAGVPAHLLPAYDAAGLAARRRLGGRLTDPGTIAVLEFASTLAKPVPTKAWLRQGEALLRDTPPAVAAVRDVLDVYTGTTGWTREAQDRLVRGLCWLAATDLSEETTVLLARVAESAGRSPGRTAEPRASRTAAAVIEILVERPGPEPARVLARLALTARSKPVRARVRTGLERMGTVRGWEPGEALELAVDHHDLDADGRRSWPAPGGHTVIAEIAGEKAVARAWRAGQPLRSMPAAIRDDEVVKAAKEFAKQVTATLATERVRVEALSSLDRVWEWETWERRYLRHPVTGTLGRRLIWQVSTDRRRWVTGLPEPAGDGWSVGGLSGPGCAVRLWHPVAADAAEVSGWRDRITAAGLRQPFKQAFREVYRLTPAEEQTRVYSNRFAGHILRYGQAHALMRVRGWSAGFLGPWGGGCHSEAVKEFAAGGWQASFFHEAVESGGHEAEFCSTDQVRFARREGRRWEPSPLAEVPPRVLSEAMRDVDLFVGVTSIAADESWFDRGEHPFRAYWSNAVSGPLSGSAEVRRDVLARLLPGLAIGPKCELTDRFLRVRGTRAVYRIHLGSGNVLMEPNDAYLCIVPGSRGARVSLPFDDDERLSLILSKAFLLAADQRITDPTILSQLPR